MPHFYLHLMNGSGFTEDQLGADYVDVDDARTKAILGLRDVIAGEVMQGKLHLGSHIEIDDQYRAHVTTVHLDEAVDVTSRPFGSTRQTAPATNQP